MATKEVSKNLASYPPAEITNSNAEYYLEITKPPWPGHLGKYLWAPHDKKYWDGREGKISSLRKGDVIIHDWKGKIVGYSTVSELPKVVTKEELIELFKSEGIWDDEYQKFAESWFQKSRDGKFYLVKLSGLNEFNEHKQYSKINGLPQPTRLQGVYLVKLDPEVGKQFVEVPKLESTNLMTYLASEGYYFPEHLVAQFYTALKTKGFVILSGLSGTGKTKMAIEFAKLLSNRNKNHLFLSVHPDWRDSKPLIGYYNPLTKEYHKTPLLKLILVAKEDYDKNKEKAMPYFIILDEMNLAHVEYYFADFLSVLESGRDENGFTRESIKLHDVDKVEKEQGIPKELKLPPNLYIIGTVNIDETTYMFSPKVLDRAFTIELHDVELDEYLEALEKRNNRNEKDWSELRNVILKDLRRDGKFLAVSKKEDIEPALNELKKKYKKYWKILNQLNKALEPYDLHFGYRVVDEIALFFKNAKESSSEDTKIISFTNEDEIFDLALLMKILPKFHGNRKKLEKPLKAVFKICLKENQSFEELNSEKIIEMLQNWENERKEFRFPHTAKKVLRMLRQLYEIGFASFS
ncbi:hypothetical protein DRN38_00215 [Thermococci archaeon]|nr:MAG: hypothetical protein DRN38_00215 [Thermococci archaeon]